MKISKDIKFDCAHMLSYYDGKCANLHGHTYHGTITLIANELITGMVLDFNKIKEIVDQFDHAIIFSSFDCRNDAEEELFKWANKYKMRKVELLDGRSTSENITKRLKDEFLNIDGIDQAYVKLSETDGSWSEA